MTIKSALKLRIIISISKIDYDFIFLHLKQTNNLTPQNTGFPKRQGLYEVAPKMPPIYASHLPWSIDGPPDEQQVVFHLASSYAPWTRLAEITVCNSFLDAEPTAFELFPDIVPIGPLFADEEVRKPVGQFWPEDASCLEWLDGQSDSSVVYVAFGSFTIFDPRQFRELAEGLELTGRPFLWVVRPDFTSGGLTKAWFDEFQSRIAGKGMIVSWCPQQQVSYIVNNCSMLHMFCKYSDSQADQRCL
jgi:hypothetical protein